ncbi:MAG: hypothetical protein ACI4IA_03940, partial [Acutalibacteraceae bacterium]
EDDQPEKDCICKERHSSNWGAFLCAEVMFSIYQGHHSARSVDPTGSARKFHLLFLKFNTVFMIKLARGILCRHCCKLMKKGVLQKMHSAARPLFMKDEIVISEVFCRCA